MPLPFWTDLKNWLFKKKKKPYVKRSDYWLDVKGNRERIRKLKEEAPKPLSQAQIDYHAAQAQSKMDKLGFDRLNKED